MKPNQTPFLNQKYPPTKTLAIDVDGTLYVGGWLNRQVVELAKSKFAEGYDLIVWSSRGKAYSHRSMIDAGLGDFAVAISKPGYVLDDQGWDWVRHTHVLEVG